MLRRKRTDSHAPRCVGLGVRGSELGVTEIHDNLSAAAPSPTGSGGRHLLVVAAVFVAAVGVRFSMVHSWAHDPTGSGGRVLDTNGQYHPNDILYVMWGARQVESKRGIYGETISGGYHYAYGPTVAYLTWAWYRLAGGSLVTMKALFMIVDVVLMAVVYLFLRRWGRRAALIGLVFYAASASALFVGSMRGKEDVLALLLMLLSVMALTGEGWWAVLAAAVAAAMSYTVKPIVLFGFVPMGIYILQRKGVLRGLAFAAVFLATATLIVSWEWSRSGFLPLLPTHVAEQTRHVGGVSVFCLVRMIAEIPAPFPGKGFVWWLDLMLRTRPVDLPLLGGAYVLCLWLLWRRNRRQPEILLLKGCAVGLILSATLKTVIWSHYHYWAVPFVVILAAIERSEKGPLRLGRTVLGAVLVVFALTWFNVTWRDHHYADNPRDIWNVLFLAYLLLGTALVMPGRFGRPMALIVTGAMLFCMGRIDWLDRLLGFHDENVSMTLNRLAWMALIYVGSAVLVVRLIRRPIVSENLPRP